jgi:poly(A) polymerase
VLHEQQRHVTIPKRFSVPMREIWSLQSRLERRAGQQAFRLLENKRFRAAYDFLLLRAEIGEADQALADWWTRFQSVGDNDRRVMVAEFSTSGGGSGKRRRRRKRRPSSGQAPRHE